MHQHNMTRRALTLVELLVVVTILVILVAVVLPLAAPALKGREVREGARQLNSLLTRIQGEAITKGRNHGIALVNQPATNLCFQVAPVKERGVYSGADADVRITIDSSGGFGVPNIRFVEGTEPFDPMMHRQNTDALKSLVTNRLKVEGQNDEADRLMPFFIKLNYRGVWHQMRMIEQQFPVPGFYLEFVDPNTMNRLDGETTAASFQIKLPPRASATLGPSIDLPKGAFINMATAGWSVMEDVDADNDGLPDNPPYGDNYFTFTGFNVIMIMFGPDGRLTQIWRDNAPVVPHPAVTLPNEPQKYNFDTPIDTVFLDLQNDSEGAPSYWVTIGNSTGRIATGENTGSRADDYVGITATGR